MTEVVHGFRFASMPGVENVIIATDGNSVPAAVLGLPTAGDNTQVINLEAAQNVTISGKNQTIGNNSTNRQLFGNITLTNDAGVDRIITLDNTARLSNLVNGIRQDGVLSVANLTMNQAGGTSATRNVTIDSAGERTVANAIASFNGRDVQTLDLVGTQDLTIFVDEIANQAAAAGVTVSTVLDIDASDLEGELNFAIDGAMIGNWGTAVGLTDRIVGTEGDSDTLMLFNAQGNSPVTVTGFETIQFGKAATTMYGDLTTVLAVDATGIYDAQNTAATEFVIADDIAADSALTLNNLGSGVTVTMGDANRDAAGAVVNSQIFDDTITLNSGAVAGTPAATLNVNYLSNIVGGQALALNIGNSILGTAGDDTDGYQAVTIDIAHAGNLTNPAGLSSGVDARTFALVLTEDTRSLTITGGADNNGFRDTLDLTAAATNELVNALNTVDISGYEGDVTITMQQGDFITAADALAQTDVRFIMSEDDAVITLSDMDGSLAAGTGVQHNSVFEFTGAKSTTDISDWTITNVVGAGEVGATIDNITRFDLTDLGITSFDQVAISLTDVTGGGAAAGTLYIRSEAQDDATVLTGTAQNTWEIEIVGLLGTLVAAELTEDNFIFA